MPGRPGGFRHPQWRRRGIAGCSDQTFDDQIDSSANGGWSHSGVGIDINGANLVAGKALGDIYDSWARFDPVTIPAGARIDVAYISPNARFTGNDGSQKTNIYMCAEDDPAAPTTQPEHAADPRTTAFTAYDDVDFTIDEEVNSPDISDAVQEVVDRAGWASGQAMMVLWDDDGSVNGNYCQPWDFDGSAPKSLKFHVEYCG